MSQPVNRSPYLKIFLDFKDVWPLMADMPLTYSEKQNLVYHILSFMEIEFQAVLSAINNNTPPNDENLLSILDSDSVVILATAIYNLVSYNNLFVIEVDDDSCGLVREFPWGALHVDHNTLILIGEGLPKLVTIAYQPTALELLAASTNGVSSKIV